MPGLLRGMARTAVIAGTATHVSNNVSRRQAQRWSQQVAAEQQYQQPVQQAAPEQDETVAQLQQLATLRDQGILNEEEFQAKKKQILGI